MDVDASANQSKRVEFRRIYNDEPIVRAGRWKLCLQPVGNLLQIVIRVVYNIKFAANLFVHHLAEPFFLLLGEEVVSGDALQALRHATWRTFASARLCPGR